MMIRSATEMKTFEVVATDGRIGAVDDFSFDDARRAIRDVVMEHVDRQWEAAFYRHLQRPGYWLTGDDARTITEAQAYLRDEPDRHEVSVERRSRRR